MLKGLKTLFGGGGNDGTIKKLEVVAKRIIDELGPKFANLSDEELKGKTAEFRARLEEGEDLDDLLEEAFAAVREAAWRTQKKKHYKVQLIAGMVLHQGKIAEMRTGEGKTLMATTAAYLNALEGKGVHVISVNDYLSKRDTQWMGPTYHALGLSVGVLQSNGGDPYRPSAFILQPGYIDPKDPTMNNLVAVKRQEAYQCDITFGTNSEFGFDYLRDNMSTSIEACVQRELHYAIVDEVDNILIDEARTPLIISGPSTRKNDDEYKQFADLVRTLKKGRLIEDPQTLEKREEGDYYVDEKKRTVTLTQQGIDKVERKLSIPEIESIYDDKWSHYVVYLENALKAQSLYLRDREYIVNDAGEVVIVDEFTGRMMEGRRYEGGLHQAIEAKEGVRSQSETLTYASITLQNYFRMYKKLAGMTGTAVTEAEEFHKIYGLDVVVIPTNREMIRKDFTDFIYRNEASKFRAVVGEIVEMNEIGRPVLVGTVSVEKSEELSRMLNKYGIKHNVLNAKLHEKESQIVAQAGRPGAVTIATNMAGRGTDIVLGGSPESYIEEELKERGLTEADRGTEGYQEAVEMAEARWQEAHDKVVELGGLHIIGTERHESRRIDNQLRGRAGRQGDPGSSRFYVSLDDELMRRFGSERVGGMLERFGFDEDTPIENGLISKTIEQAQTKVEGQNFDYRKHLVEYDDVMNKQRDQIYKDRRRALMGENLKDQIINFTKERVHEIVEEYTAGEHEEWDLPRLIRNVALLIQTKPLELSYRPKDEEEMEQMVLEALQQEIGVTVEELDGLNREAITEIMDEVVERVYEAKEERLGREEMQVIERLVILNILDENWVNYLTPMEVLRQGISLRSYGQQDPLVAYRTSAFKMFGELQTDIKREIVQRFWSAELQKAPPPPARPAPTQMQESGPGTENRNGNGKSAKAQPAKSNKIGPNEPCFCGSGKKYKKCHGANVR